MLDIELPPGVHATVLRGRDIVSGEMLAYPVVWADRAYDRCPRCDQPIGNEVDECPVLLNTGAGQLGQIEEWSKQHGCGEWLSVEWVAGDDTEEDQLTAATEQLIARLTC